MAGVLPQNKSFSSCRVQGSDRTKAPSLLTPHCPCPAVFCLGIQSLPFPDVSAPDLSASASPELLCRTPARTQAPAQGWGGSAARV